MDGAQQTNNTEGGWAYRPEAGAAPAAQPTTPAISWTASEFVAHQKSGGWYFVLTVLAVAAAAVVFFVTHDLVNSVVILLAAFGFGFMAARKPRELMYQLDNRGIAIGQKYYPYTAFRSFSVIQEGAFSSIVLMPLKRFAPLTTAYYDPADEQAIVNTLSAHLPMENRQNDALDRFLWRIRF